MLCGYVATKTICETKTNQNKSYAHFNLFKKRLYSRKIFHKMPWGPPRGPIVLGPLVLCLKVHTVRYATDGDARFSLYVLC